MIFLNCTSLIILIIFEIALTSFAVIKLNRSIEKVEAINKKLSFAANSTLVICNKVKEYVFKVNKFVSIITSKKIQRIHTVIKYALNIAEIVILIRTMDFSKGIKSLNYKNIKKLLLANVSKKLIFRIMNFICS